MFFEDKSMYLSILLFLALLTSWVGVVKMIIGPNNLASLPLFWYNLVCYSIVYSSIFSIV